MFDLRDVVQIQHSLCAENKRDSQSMDLVPQALSPHNLIQRKQHADCPLKPASLSVKALLEMVHITNHPNLNRHLKKEYLQAKNRLVPCRQQSYYFYNRHS